MESIKKVVVLPPNECFKLWISTAEVSKVGAEGIQGIPAAAAQLDHSLPAPPARALTAQGAPQEQRGAQHL